MLSFSGYMIDMHVMFPGLNVLTYERINIGANDKFRVIYRLNSRVHGSKI